MMNILKKHKALIIFVLIFCIVILLYGRLVNLYFSQDDFFHLRVSQTDGSLGEFLRLGTFRSFQDRGGIYFYRPIFREFLFNIYYRLFGLTVVPFRITQFLIHFINIILVYKLVNILTKKNITAAFSAFFFAITAPNIGIFSYLAGGIQVAGALLFYLLSVILFMKYLDSHVIKYKILTAIFFILALASHELALSLPTILMAVHLVKLGINKNSLIKAMKITCPLFLIAAIYVFLEVKIIGFPVGEAQYALSFSPTRLVNSYVWYFLWSLGIPEMLLDFVGPGIKLNPNLMRYWGDYFRLIFPLIVIILGFLVISFKRLAKLKIFWFFVFWFIVGITPVIFQPAHKQYYYLGISLVGVSGVFGLIFESLRKRKVFLVSLVLAFILLTLISSQLSYKTYWSISRSDIAQSLIHDVLNKYPTLPNGASVYFTNDPNSPYINQEWGNSSKQASVILSGSDALGLLYKDPTLKVYYEDLEKPPKDKKVYSLNAIIYRNIK